VRRLLLLAALAALSAAGTACDVSPPAATVDGSTVSRSQLDSQLSAISKSSYAQCALELQGLSLPSSLTGAGDFTVSSQLASYELSTLVVGQLIDRDLARRGRSVNTGDLADARADLATQLTPSGGSASPCPGAIAGETLVDRLPAGFRDQQVQFLAAEEKLAVTLGHVDVSPAALLAFYRAHPTQFQEVCLSDIAVDSQSQAQSLRAAIVSGSATFAAEAEQNSLDTDTAASGGQIPCVPSSEIVNSVIVSAIAGLSAGQISQPVFEQTSSSVGGIWFLLEVDGRPSIPFSQAESQIRQQLLSAQNATVSAALSRAAKAAKVSVDPRYGSWSAAEGISPPKAPPEADLLSSSADQPPGSSASG
jgi:parvulin-like peptidyl-prolyl isomerase